MNKLIGYAMAMFVVLPSLVLAAEPVELSETAYKKELGVIIIQINWGRLGNVVNLKTHNFKD